MSITSDARDRNSIRVAAVSMVKNEGDILELFIKVNSRHIDHFCILDHGSDDATAEIVRNLRARGHSIDYHLLDNIQFRQAEVLTRKIRELARSEQFDYLIPLDGDEFLASETGVQPKKVFSDMLAADGIGLVPWKTYCPITDLYFESKAPLFENFRARRTEVKQFFKVVLGNEYAKGCVLAEGNHLASNHRFDAPGVTLSLVLQHIPVRSSSQIIRKAILGSHALALKETRRPGEGFHWDQIASLIRQKNFVMHSADLTSIALAYAVPLGQGGANDVDMDSMRVGAIDDAIEWPELAQISLLKSFDDYVSDLVSEIVRNRPKRSASAARRGDQGAKGIWRWIPKPLRPMVARIVERF